MGRPHLHGHCNFAESILKTVPKSFCLSCGSELHVQSKQFPVAWTISSSRLLWSLRVVSTGSIMTSLGITYDFISLGFTDTAEFLIRITSETGGSIHQTRNFATIDFSLSLHW